ncbi:NAD-dependent epimerase/dehydratase family protein [Clostridium bowmanii]|uniref:NAD-dependent epimerase/dehydratase family protein n=1 Tax=Clostridium bowmanii TaxID=132925 RepID=UPI001C0E582F|nr:NAD-dependent epimerase/dehydratase family protein [Clostridium bowmanii]MBU3191623.1 NAD-dependent epimerase/dehydratase family protein [Clostridium bowmanii]MCA1075901.1 NAD-dependent epimerase/dehydratase family protein [Clostridium bowmanii]
MCKKVLITGASGFVGSCLVRRLLSENYKIHIITRDTTNLWRLQDIIKHLEIHNIDLLDSQKIAKLASTISIDQVFHLATYGGYYYQSKLEEVINTNVIATWNIFREFSKKGIEMFVNTSSSSEYGEKFEPMSEDMKVEPNNMYGASKAAATILCSTYASMNKIPMVTLRLFSPYGYYDAKTRLIPTVITACLREQEIKLSQKHSMRDFIFIDDVVEAYLAVSRLENSQGEIFNIGNGIQYTIEDIANNIVSLIGKGNIIHWTNNLERQYEPAMWVSDNKKVYEKLNWKPKVEIGEGINKTINWFRNNLEFYR